MPDQSASQKWDYCRDLPRATLHRMNPIATKIPAAMEYTLRVLSQSTVDELHVATNLRLRVAGRVVDVGALRVVGQHEKPRLTSKAMAVLLELVEHAGDTVSRDQLLDRVWNGRCPTPDVLTQAIKELRRALGDDKRPPRYIETIPKVGYRLTAVVQVLGEDGGSRLEAGLATNGGDGIDVAVPDVSRDYVTEQAEPLGGSALRVISMTVAAIVLVLLAVAIARAWFMARRAPFLNGSAPAWRVVDERTVTSDPGAEWRPSVSPDGLRIAYSKMDDASGVDHILVRSIRESRPVDLISDARKWVEMPSWSPDGSQIAFEEVRHGDCSIWVAASLGGDVRKVGACHDHESYYFDWTPDGRHLIADETSDDGKGGLALLRWNLDTGVRQPLHYSRAKDDDDLEPHYSPNGRWIAFRRGIAPSSDLMIMPVNGGAVRQVTHVATRIRGYTWTPDSRGLVFSSNLAGRFALYTVVIDRGEPQPLGVEPAVYPVLARAADTIVYEIPRSRDTLAEIAIGSDPVKPQFIAQSTGSDSSPALSPSGDRIAFVSDRSGSQQLWLYDSATKSASMLTDFNSAVLHSPNFSADGGSVLVTVRRAHQGRLIEVDLATRRQRVVSPPDESVRLGMYGPKPSTLITLLGESGERGNLELLRGAAGAQPMRRLLARDVEQVQVDAKAGILYYTKSAVRGLFRRDLASDQEQFVTARLGDSNMNSWRVVDGRIWYMAAVGMNPTVLREFDPNDGSDHLIANLNVRLRDVTFSIAPARDRIVVTPVVAEDTDVGAFRLVAAGQ